jgi:hypothetical protein
MALPWPSAFMWTTWAPARSTCLWPEHSVETWGRWGKKHVKHKARKCWVWTSMFVITWSCFFGSMMFYFRFLVFKFGMSHFPAGWIWSWCFWTVSPPTGNVGVSGSKTLALTVLTVGTAPSGGARYETAIRRRQLRIFGMIPSKYLHNLTHMYIYIIVYIYIYIIIYI